MVQYHGASVSVELHRFIITLDVAPLRLSSRKSFEDVDTASSKIGCFQSIVHRKQPVAKSAASSRI